MALAAGGALRVSYHSDDLGSTPEATRRLLEAWKDGLLDGMSLLVNGTATEMVPGALVSDPRRPLRMIAHLNLCEGPSLARAEEVPLLVNSAGFLDLGFGKVLKIMIFGKRSTRMELLRQIELEWRAQIREAKRICSPRPEVLVGVDGHTHVHMIPQLFDIALKLMREEGLKEVRVTRELLFFSKDIKDSLNAHVPINILKVMLLRGFSLIASRRLRATSAGSSASSDVLLGVLYSGMMTRGAVVGGLEAARRDGARRVEVLMHIGRSTEREVDLWDPGALSREFFTSPKRDQEFRALKTLRNPGGM